MLVLFFKVQYSEQLFFTCAMEEKQVLDLWKCLTIQTQGILPETEISTQTINNSVAFPTETEDVR